MSAQLNLKEIIENHKLWLLGDGGERASLREADLRGADLRGASLRGADLREADLRDAVGDMARIKNIFLEAYSITYTSKIIYIGCQKHTISDWEAFSDREILEMDGKKALAFWKKYKALIFQCIKTSPAE